MEPLAKGYRVAVRDVLIIQVVLGGLSALMLDYGYFFQMWYISMAAYWPMAGMLIVRAKSKPNRIDPYVIRWSFLLIFFLLSPLITGLVWHWRGMLG